VSLEVVVEALNSSLTNSGASPLVIPLLLPLKHIPPHVSQLWVHTLWNSLMMQWTSHPTTWESNPSILCLTTMVLPEAQMTLEMISPMAIPMT